VISKQEVKNQIYKQKGFTLIEVIIYISISSVLLIVVLSFIRNFLIVRNKITIKSKVQQNARYAMARMVKEVRYADDLEVVDQNTLRLYVGDSERNPIYFDLQDGVLYIKEGLGEFVAITGNDVKVGDVLFEDRTTPNSADIVKITLTISNLETSKSPDSQSTINLNTYVAKR